MAEEKNNDFKSRISIDDNGMVTGLTQSDYESLELYKKDCMKYKDQRNEARTENESLKSGMDNTTSQSTSLLEKNTELKDELKRLKVHSAVKLKALSMGAGDPDDILRIADLSGIEVQESGEITGVEDAITTLKSKKGYLFDQDSIPAPGVYTGSGGKGAPSMTYESLIADTNRAREFRQAYPERFKTMEKDFLANRMKKGKSGGPVHD